MKDHVKRMKRQATDWGKIFANHISEKGLTPRIYKGFLKQKEKISLENKQKTLTEVLPKRIYS